MSRGGSSGVDVSLGPVRGGSSRAEMAEEMLSCRSRFLATESSSSEEKEGSVSRLRFSSSSSRLQGEGQPSPSPSLSAASKAQWARWVVGAAGLGWAQRLAHS